MTHLKKRKPTNQDLDFLDRMDDLLTQSNKSTHSPKVTQIHNEDVVKYHNIITPIKQIVLSDHALQRAAERFNLKDQGQATGTVRKWLKYATLIGETVSDDGTHGITFTYEKREIILSMDLKTVITLNEHQVLGYSPIKDDLINLHRREFNKLSRRIKSKSRMLKENQLEADLEIAELKLRIFRTRSIAVKNSSKARIEALNISLKEEQFELKKLQDKRRQLARGLVSIM